MKKISVLLITVLLMMSFISCGGDKITDDSTEDYMVKMDNVIESQSTSNDENTNKYDGVVASSAVYNKSNSAQYFNLSFPSSDLRDVLYGRGSATVEGIWAFCGGSFINDTIECKSIEGIFDAYSDRWSETVQDMHHDSAYSDCKFTAEKREMTEINGFSMCRYEGTHTYNHTDFTTGAITPYSCYFVAYGTQLSEGGYVYWIVFDNSADQSLRDIVNKNAENMAKSLEETTLF